jgi:hypothetical protein
VVPFDSRGRLSRLAETVKAGLQSDASGVRASAEDLSRRLTLIYLIALADPVWIAK